MSTTLGKPYVPVDEDNEFHWFHMCGQQFSGPEVDSGERVTGTLINVDVQGLAALERDGFCAGYVPVDQLERS